MVSTLTAQVFLKCTHCGSPTEWDPELGPLVLCVHCWDKASENYIRGIRYASKRRYYQEHKPELAAYQRKYYQGHRKILAGENV